MTTRDKRQLHNMLLTVARFQRKSALPDKRSVSAPELNFNAPQYRFEERVQYLISDGLTREKAEACVKELILKDQPKAATAGKVVRVEQLIPGQRFRSPSEEEEREHKKNGVPVNVITGVLLYKTPSRARVLLDPGAPTEHTFTNRKGDQVTINSAGRKEQNLAPDCLVKVLPETENVALLLSKTELQSGTSSETKNSTSKENDDMAKAKKNPVSKKAVTAKKAVNGEASARPRFSAEAVVKRLKGPAEGAIKRHVDILTTLKENGDKMTLKELGKAFGKVAGTKQDPVKVILMHRKALTDGGFISVTEPTASA